MSEFHGSSQHWGEWVKARTQYVGWKNQGSLADSMGCTRQHLCRLFTMEKPPETMRRRLDESLCLALKTDAKTLFTDYVVTDPTHAPIVEPPAAPPATSYRAKLSAAIDHLSEDRIRVLAATAEALVTAA
jgi:hypothetical protein